MGKKILLVSCFMALLCSGVRADDKVAGLIVSTGSGTQDIALSSISSIKFDETQMVVSFKNGNTTSIAFDDVQTMTFGEVSSATAVRQILGMKHGKMTISDLQGRTVWSGKSGDKMPKMKGVYVISDGKKSQVVTIKE